MESSESYHIGERPHTSFGSSMCCVRCRVRNNICPLTGDPVFDVVDVDGNAAEFRYSLLRCALGTTVGGACHDGFAICVRVSDFDCIITAAMSERWGTLRPCSTIRVRNLARCWMTAPAVMVGTSHSLPAPMGYSDIPDTGSLSVLDDLPSFIAADCLLSHASSEY